MKSEKLRKIWKNRGQILEGVANSLIIKEEIEKIARDRLDICRSCIYYDRDGTSEKVVLKGLEACSVCGCSLHLKVHCMSCSCAMEELEQTPLWTAELTTEEEDSLPLDPND